MKIALDFFFEFRYRSKNAFPLRFKNLDISTLPMENRHFFLNRNFIIHFVAIGCIVFFAVGCKNSGRSQPSNPFAMDRQTAPPPATFAAQAAYLGQTSAPAYTPQSPASVYNSATDSTPCPNGASVYPGTTTAPSGGYGSINSSPGASVFQNTATAPVNVSSNGWTTPDASLLPQTSELLNTSTEIASASGRQTAAQSMATQAGTITQTAADGSLQTTYVNPDSLVVSSAQLTTKVLDDGPKTPETIMAEPKTMYAGQYQ